MKEKEKDIKMCVLEKKFLTSMNKLYLKSNTLSSSLAFSYPISYYS